MKAKWGCLITLAATLLVSSSSVAKAVDGKSPLAGLKNVAVVVESLPDEITKAKITATDIQVDAKQKLSILGNLVLEKSDGSPTLSLAIASESDSTNNGFAVCCSLSLKKRIVLPAKEAGEEAIMWQKNRFATCKAEEIGDTVKWCLAETLDAFSKEYAAANQKAAGGQDMLTGQVKFQDIEGGFYGILADDGQKFDPVNLPTQFKKDGLRVRFAIKPKEGAMSFHMWGKIVEIVNIETAGKEIDMPVTLQWLGHASFKICWSGQVIYIDPWKLKDTPADATIVCVSHSHSDHYSTDDLKKVWSIKTRLIAPSDVVAKEGKGETIWPGQTIEIAGVKITGTPAYNPAKQFHPKANNWLGFVIEVGSLRIYYAGDTDIIDEMKSLKDIDVALLPVGGKYTMNTEEAAAAVKIIKPKQAVPYHFGDIVGSPDDGRKFARIADCDVLLIKPGDIVSLTAL